jgi:hypothetical protein
MATMITELEQLEKQRAQAVESLDKTHTLLLAEEVNLAALRTAHEKSLSDLGNGRKGGDPVQLSAKIHFATTTIQALRSEESEKRRAVESFAQPISNAYVAQFRRTT